MPKKIDTLKVEGQFTSTTVNLCFDKISAMFSATIVDRTFAHKDLKELELLLRKAWREQEVVKFERYIVVNYTRHHDRRHQNGSWSSSGSGFPTDFSEERAERNNRPPVSGISMIWSVFDISEPLWVGSNRSRDRHQERLWYKLKENPHDGSWFRTELAPYHDDISENDNDFQHAIPFTIERVRALEGIQIGIQAIDAKLIELLDQRGAAIGKRLDAFKEGLGLFSGSAPAPKALPAPKKVRRRVSPP